MISAIVIQDELAMETNIKRLFSATEGDRSVMIHDDDIEFASYKLPQGSTSLRQHVTAI